MLEGDDSGSELLGASSKTCFASLFSCSARQMRRKRLGEQFSLNGEPLPAVVQIPGLEPLSAIEIIYEIVRRRLQISFLLSIEGSAEAQPEGIAED